MRWVYVLASYVLFWVLFPFLSIHRKTRHGLLQRLGLYRPDELPQGNGPRFWLHGASAGDLLALLPVIERLRARFPDAQVIVSTTTNTGHLMATERLRGLVDRVIYAPYDLWGATRRAVQAVAPSLLVLEYAEIWPNWIRAAKAHGASVVLTNGRFSPEHLEKYELLFAAVENPLLDIDLFLMREEDEGERAQRLGAPRERVRVTGNTKFDALASTVSQGPDDGLQQALGLPSDARVLIAGSTHEGEEELLFGVYRKLIREHADLRMVVAPRYIDRAARVASLAREAGLSVGLRSERNRTGGQVVVLDTIGELARAYRLATLVFVGGSFTSRGGQNILEPAAQGKPVLFGPHMENFHDSVHILVGRGAIQVNDVAQLHRVLADLLSRPDTVAALGELARNAVAQVAGASDRNVELISRLLTRAPARPSAQRVRA